MMLCLNCQKNEARIDPEFGVLPCESCNEKQKNITSKKVHEFVTPEIQEERIKFQKDTLQPYRQGRLSREYLEAHGTSRLDITPEEASKAEYVWDDQVYYKNHD